MTGYVYAFSDGDRVKIGYSEKPKARLHQVRCNSGADFEMVGAVEATEAQEADLHALLAPECIRGREWYRPDTPRVAHFLKCVAGRNLELGTLRQYAKTTAPGLEPARTIIARLGGEAVVRKITGTGAGPAYSWQAPKSEGGTGGVIPWKHVQPLLDYARESGIPLTADDFLPVAAQEPPSPPPTGEAA